MLYKRPNCMKQERHYSKASLVSRIPVNMVQNSYIRQKSIVSFRFLNIVTKDPLNY